MINIASTFHRNTRSSDLIGRWGGEEFLGIYTISRDYEAPIIANKIRELVYNSDVSYNDSFLRVSISVGITVARDDDTIESLIARADRYMYQSKNGGKNRVVSD